MEGRGLIGRGWMAGGIRRLGFIFDKEEFLTLIECVKNKRRNYFLKIYPDGQSCGNFGKKKLRKLQRNKIRYFQNLYPLRYYTPRKIRSLFQPLLPASSAQHTDSTYLVYQHRRHTSQLIVGKQNCSYTHSQTHDDGPPSRARRLETGARVWRGRSTLGYLGCSLPLLACPGNNACSYECGLDMPEC